VALELGLTRIQICGKYHFRLFVIETNTELFVFTLTGLRIPFSSKTRCWPCL